MDNSNRTFTYICTGCSKEMPSGIMNFINHDGECPKDNPSEQIKWEWGNDPSFNLTAEEKSQFAENKRINDQRDKDFTSIFHLMNEKEQYRYLWFGVRGHQINGIIYTSLQILNEYKEFQNEMIKKYK